MNTTGNTISLSNVQTQWDEARSVFPIYLSLAKYFDLPSAFSSAKKALPDRPSEEHLNQVLRWLDEMDEKVQTHQLRKLLQTTTLSSSEEGLRALILRHLRKPTKSTFDRDKIDFLLVQYFALCSPPKIYHKQIELLDVAQVLKPVLGEVDPTPLEWCEPLENMIEMLRTFKSLRELLKTEFIAEGRHVKETAGGMFYDPAALLAFIRFNFLLRRAFIELMHADLIATRSTLNHLESAGVRLVDCQRAGLSDAESTNRLLQLCNDWKQPFQKEYTENSVGTAFQKLLALRSAVEECLELHRSNFGAPETLSASERPAAPVPGPRIVPATPDSVQKAPLKSVFSKSSSPAAAESSLKAAFASKSSLASPLPAAPTPEALLDLDACVEKIWEQLIAVPPTRGRSMTTVVVGKTRILMSSWEVAAFLTDAGSSSDDLRRAVSARAIVAIAIESFEMTKDRKALRKALDVAGKEISMLQERVASAKRAKNTETAVNLGISTKRLLSVLDEAEKL
ncbi:MAG TPA: hypothetical protein VOA41_11170 [Candidatus Dormibacteraeota bacterium]|nr:hypothetical protein [Candidatus Dormibacteraeota bacterium]